MKRCLILGILVSLSAGALAQSGWSVSMPLGFSTLHKAPEVPIAADMLFGPSIGAFAGYTLGNSVVRWKLQIDLGGIYHGVRFLSPSHPEEGAILRHIFLLAGSTQLRREFGERHHLLIGLGCQPEIAIARSEFSFMSNTPPYNISGVVSVAYKIADQWHIGVQTDLGYTNIYQLPADDNPNLDPDDYVLNMRRLVTTIRYYF